MNKRNKRNKRYSIIALITALMLLLTACSSRGQVMDGADMIRETGAKADQAAQDEGRETDTQADQDTGRKTQGDAKDTQSEDEATRDAAKEGQGDAKDTQSEDEATRDAAKEGQDEAKDMRAVGKFDFASEKVLLNSGWEMPIIGTGTWTLSDEEAENSTYYALKAGMRLIDTAQYYQNETGVGRGLARAIDEGIVTREDVFITTKIYGGDHDRAAEKINNSLSDLGVDYIDLMLIHQPGADDAGVYKAMEEAVESGKLHSIGISNYYAEEQVDEVLSFAKITPAVIQNENHIYYQNARLRDYVKQYGIVMESWYPFGGRGHTQENFENEVIMDLAEKYGKTSAQIILRWHLQDGYIAIPGSGNPEHIAENYHIFDFELSEDEMSRIRGLDEQRRYEHW